MKRYFSQKIVGILLLFAISFSSFAQDEVDTTYITQMNNIFGSLEKSRVPYGLLQDYAFDFTDLGNFNGVFTDSNEVNSRILTHFYICKTL